MLIKIYKYTEYMFTNKLLELQMNELKKLNYGRILILEKFGELINKVQLNKKLNIAVVGGSENEPEIIFLKKLNYQLEVKTFGIENNDFFLDLNKNDNE